MNMHQGPSNHSRSLKSMPAYTPFEAGRTGLERRVSGHRLERPTVVRRPLVHVHRPACLASPAISPPRLSRVREISRLVANTGKLWNLGRRRPDGPHRFRMNGIG